MSVESKMFIGAVIFNVVAASFYVIVLSFKAMAQVKEIGTVKCIRCSHTGIPTLGPFSLKIVCAKCQSDQWAAVNTSPSLAAELKVELVSPSGMGSAGVTKGQDGGGAGTRRDNAYQPEVATQGDVKCWKCGKTNDPQQENCWDCYTKLYEKP